MNKRSTTIKIGLLDHMGYGNLGDAAIQEAMIQKIRRFLPNAKIYGFSLNPENTEEMHGITSYPIRRTFQVATQPRSSKRTQTDPYKVLKVRLKNIQLFDRFVKTFRSKKLLSNIWDELSLLRKSYNILKGFNLLIISGGGQFCDNWGGPWGHPYTLFKWAMISKATRTKFVVVSVGVGPIISTLSKFFIKWSLSLASYRSYRDEESRKLLESIKFSGKGCVFPDLAYSLELDHNRKSLVWNKKFSAIIGISPIAFCDPRVWPVKDICVYQSYIRKIALFVSLLVEKRYKILLFQSQYRHDIPVINDLITILKKNGNLNLEEYIHNEPIYNVSDLISQISCADLIVASRYHSVLLSHLMYKPTLAITYHQKVYAQMDEMGLSEYCLDIETFDSTSLVERFFLLESNKFSVRNQIEQRIQTYKNKLDHQYTYVFSRFI